MATSNREVDTSEAVRSLVNAYDEMDLPARIYVPAVLVPALLFFLGTIVAAIALDVLLFVRLLLPVLGLLLLAAAAAYPKIALDARRVEMENRYPLLVIHMTLLSTTNIERMEVFRELAREEEYGELADEMQRVVDLVDIWHLSLGEACRRRADAVPSESVGDFLERMAYTLEAGQSLGEFLTQEQEVLIEQYSTVYRQSLSNLDVLKDLYLSMLISMTFGLVFAIVLPLLTGNDPTITASIVIVLFVFVQLGFLFIIRASVPHDPIWYFEPGYRPRVKKKLLGSIAVGVTLTLLLVLVMTVLFLGDSPAVIDSLPYLFFMPIVTIPLLIPGVVFYLEERRVFQRDQAFPNFIRALGASESARQSTTTEVLESLRDKSFGALTDHVDDLYRRLNMRLSQERSWRYFTGDCCSYLIQKFSEMYLVGRKMGGSQKQLGELISTNMNAILSLREERRQKTTTLVGVIYGITAAASFSFFIGLELAILLSSFDVNISEGPVDQLIHTDQYDVALLRYLIVVVLVFNALISSIVLRVTDGGHFGNSYLHFTFLLWIGAIVGTITERLVGLLITADL